MTGESAVSVETTFEEEIASFDEESLLEIETCKSKKKSACYVKIEVELRVSWSKMLQILIEDHSTVLSSLQGVITEIEHRIKLVDEKPVRSKTYPMCYARDVKPCSR